MTTGRIKKLRFYEPSRNLPDHPGGRSRESALTCRFGQAFVDLSSSEHGHPKQSALALAREIPANGYGIADLVAVRWNPRRASVTKPPLEPEVFVKLVNPTLCAFEVKLRDWRRALMQANRYRFFAHVAVVVLPETICHRALEHIDTFRMVGVGLWSFDPKTNCITRHFTPRPVAPLDPRHEVRVLRLVARVSRSLPVS